MLRYNILRAEIYRHRKNKIFIGVWLSLVECLVRDQEAGGSNPLTPTSKTKAKKAESIDAICVFRLFLFLSVNEVLPQKVRLVLSNCCQKFCLSKII